MFSGIRLGSITSTAITGPVFMRVAKLPYDDPLTYLNGVLNSVFARNLSRINRDCYKGWPGGLGSIYLGRGYLGRRYIDDRALPLFTSI
jgi:hypothetical protein